ncbi:MAG: hypothetical protein MZU84_06170 [Sphingobacterium sp.]|nr:hypothetical protein [Sphingobacterium sp.]
MLTPEEGGGEEFKLVQNRMVLFKSDELGQEKARLGEYLDVTMLRKMQKDDDLEPDLTRVLHDLLACRPRRPGVYRL